MTDDKWFVSNMFLIIHGHPSTLKILVILHSVNMFIFVLFSEKQLGGGSSKPSACYRVVERTKSLHMMIIIIIMERPMATRSCSPM